MKTMSLRGEMVPSEGKPMKALGGCTESRRFSCSGSALASTAFRGAVAHAARTIDWHQQCADNNHFAA